MFYSHFIKNGSKVPRMLSKNNGILFPENVLYYGCRRRVGRPGHRRTQMAPRATKSLYFAGVFPKKAIQGCIFGHRLFICIALILRFYI